MTMTSSLCDDDDRQDLRLGDDFCPPPSHSDGLRRERLLRLTCSSSMTSTLSILLRDRILMKGRQQQDTITRNTPTPRSLKVFHVDFENLFRFSRTRLERLWQYVTNARKRSQRKAKKRDIVTTATVTGTTRLVSMQLESLEKIWGSYT